MARMRTYLRPHKNNAPDALQYTPSFSGADTNWQLFHGPGGTAPSPTQNTEEGIAVEIVFEGRDAAIFIGDDTEPAPMRPRTLVANTTSCRRPGRALPTIVSDSPEEYTSAVSIKSMPPSSARPTIASTDVSSSPPIACQIWRPCRRTSWLRGKALKRIHRYLRAHGTS